MAGTVITAKGRALIAKLLSLESGIVFTRASVGTGILPGGYDPGNMTDLNQYRMDGKITAASADQEVANVTFQITSDHVEEGFLVTEAGLFARDPDEGEILYAYLDLSDDPQYIYKKGGNVDKVAEITLGVVIGQIDKVTAVIAPDGLINRTVFEETLKEFREQILKETAALGRVRIGNEETLLDPNDTLFLVDGWYPKKFEGAAYLDMVFQEDSPQGRERNWAKMPLTAGNRDSPENPDIISGKLAVAEEAPSGTAFFAKIN